MEALLAGGGAGDTATPEHRSAAAAAWSKADAYHYATMARLQRLFEVRIDCLLWVY